MKWRSKRHCASTFLPFLGLQYGHVLLYALLTYQVCLKFLLMDNGTTSEMFESTRVTGFRLRRNVPQVSEDYASYGLAKHSIELDGTELDEPDPKAVQSHLEAACRLPHRHACPRYYCIVWYVLIGLKRAAMNAT